MDVKYGGKKLRLVTVNVHALIITSFVLPCITGSMRNLYNDGEEDLDPTISPDSGSGSYLSQTKFGQQQNDFDDPAAILHSTPKPTESMSMSHVHYDDLFDDPIAGHEMGKIQAKRSSKGSTKTRTRSLGDSAVSLPSSAISLNNDTSRKPSSVRGRFGSTGAGKINYRSVRNPQSGNNNANNNTSSGSASSKSKNGVSSLSSSNKKLSKSTMMDTPLYLDTIT